MLHLLRNAAQYGSSLRRSFNCGLSANVPTFERLIAVDFLSNQIILGSRGLVECSWYGAESQRQFAERAAVSAQFRRKSCVHICVRVLQC